MSINLYSNLLASGTSPRLTVWGSYAGGPRLDLSGKVLANHCAKIANFLAEELLLDEGDEIRVDLPGHWRLLTWHIGALLAGVRVTDTQDPVALVTAVPGEPSTAAEEIVGLSLGALDMSVAGLPDGAHDGIADVAASPDDLIDRSRALPMAPFGLDLPAGGKLLLAGPDEERLVRMGMAVLAARRALVVVPAESASRALEVESAVLVPGH